MHTVLLYFINEYYWFIINEEALDFFSFYQVILTWNKLVEACF